MGVAKRSASCSLFDLEKLAQSWLSIIEMISFRMVTIEVIGEGLGGVGSRSKGPVLENEPCLGTLA